MTTVENVFWVKTIFFTRHVIYFPHEIWKAQTVSVMHLHTAPTGRLSFVHLLIYCNTVLIWVAHLAICATELASCCDHKATHHKTPHLLFPWKHQAIKHLTLIHQQQACFTVLFHVLLQNTACSPSDAMHRNRHASWNVLLWCCLSGWELY